MPKPGYDSFTLPIWIIECVESLKSPGEHPKNVIVTLLKSAIPIEVIKQKETEWRKKFGRN